MSRPWSRFSRSAGSPKGHAYGFLDQQGGGVDCTVKDPCLLPERLVHGV